MRILYILRHDPWGIGGGCYACRNYLEAFNEIFDDAHFDVLVCEEYLMHAHTEEFPNCRFIPVKPRGTMSKLLSPLTHVMHRHSATAKQMMSGGGYDLCIFDDNGIAGTLIDDCHGHDIKTIVLNHNCEVEYYRDNSSGLKRKLLLPSVRWNERKSYKNCDFNIFLTEEDKRLFGEFYGASETKKIVGGCFLRRGEALNTEDLVPFHKEKLRLVISGTIGNVQNLDGINYFLDELYPCLPKDFDVVIAGKNPPAELTERLKAYSNIRLIANPKNMDAVLRSCDIFLCPTRLGGGMKLRVMDGLRNGLSVIAHEVSARGYGRFAKQGLLKSFSDTESFTNAVVDYANAIVNDTIKKEVLASNAMYMLSYDMNVDKLKTALLQG